MAQHDYILDNQSGLSFRSDLNSALAAAVSQNSGTAAPSITYAYQFWADTTSGLLKQRNAANNGWVTIGILGSVNLGLATAASPSFTGTATFAGETTAQRPASPAAGMFRFNSTLGQFEG